MPVTNLRSATVPISRDALIDPATGQMSRSWLQTQLRVHAAAGWVEQFVLAVNSIEDIPTNLTGDDAGSLVGLHGDYCHMLEWTGAIWIFAPGDSGNAYYVTYPPGVLPQTGAYPPDTGTGYQLCDGSVTDFLVVGASMVSLQPFTTPVVADQYFRR